MSQEYIATLLDQQLLSLDELAASCTVSREWIIQQVQSGVLQGEPGTDPSRWSFGGQELLRARRLYRLERDFDANPELAGLVADLLDEVERLRVRLRRAGLSTD